MKHLLFLGSVDKSDFVMYLCKMLTAAGSKVLLNDATKNHWSTFYLSSMDNDLMEFEGFDVYRNEKSFAHLVSGQVATGYDFIVTDTDREDHVTFEQFRLADKRFLVTTYERSVLMMNQQIIKRIYSTVEKPNQLEVERIILSAVESNSIDEEYMNLLFEDILIIWPDESIEIPVDEVDHAIKVENQHNHRLLLKRLSRRYRSALTGICQEVTETDRRTMKTVWKTALRRA
ncbi:hypothetical protein [Paenibacillus rubinfantis]|uniref:hypothetical protein n=1 Tax=Paenibacillus rubinfantis TaxID=1720296 RepID=UPI00073ECD03|nr:hypothetical protein [Paenibacillus rubinfantis]